LEGANNAGSSPELSTSEATGSPSTASASTPSTSATPVQPAEFDAVRVAKELYGKSCYVNWPHLKEAVVLGVSDARCRVPLAGLTHPDQIVRGLTMHVPEDFGAWMKESKYQKNKTKSKKGMDIGEVKVMLHVKVLRGIRVGRDGSRARLWTMFDEIFPEQVIV
jgi:hypothetical protein